MFRFGFALVIVWIVLQYMFTSVSK